MATTYREAFTASRSIATNGHRPTRTPLLVVLGRFLGTHLPRWSAIRTVLLSVLAFGCLVVAAWGVDWRLGLAVAAPCLLILEYLSTDVTRQ